MELRKLFIVLISSLFINQISAQYTKKMYLEKPEMNEVLNEDGINAVIEDKLGFLWAGGWNGLFRYDGNQSINYTAKFDGLLGKKISCLYSATDSTVWIGTYGQGLFGFNIINNHIVSFDSASNQKLRNIYAIYEDPNKSIWIGTSENLLEYKNQQFKAYPFVIAEQGKSVNLMITAIAGDKHGSFWIGTNYGVYRFNPKNGKYARVVPEVSTYVSNILAHNDKIWICSKSGLFSLTPEKEKYSNGSFFDITRDGADLYTPSIYPSTSKPNCYWICTQNDFYLINDVDKSSTKLDLYKGTNLKLNSLIQTSFESKDNILWLGSLHGLFKVDNGPKKFTSYQNNIEGKMIFGISADISNNLWVGTWGSGLYLMNAKSNDNTLNGEPVNFGNIALKNYAQYIYSVCASKNGKDIWISTKGAGLFRLKLTNGKYTGGIKTYNTMEKNGITDDYVMNVYEDTKGNIWAGTWDGYLYRYNSALDRFEEIEYNHVLKNENHNAVLKIFQLNDDEILLGTFGRGAIKLKIPEKGTKATEGTELFFRNGKRYMRSNFVNDFIISDNKSILLATDQGLYYLKEDGNYISYSIKEGLLGESIQTLYKDENGFFWVATETGLGRLGFKGEKLISIRNYTSSDGIQRSIFQPRAITKSNDGRIFMGLSNGLVSFEPSKIKDLPIKATVLLTEFRLFNQILEPGEKTNGKIFLNQSISKTKDIELDYDENNITIGFSSMIYSVPQKIKYAYKLEGFNSDWVYTDARYPYANFNKIPHGNHTFKVKCTNSDGNWSNEITSLNIHLNPPWWKSGIAYFFYFILLAGVVLAAKYFIDYNHRMELSQLENKKNLEVFDVQLKFYTNISHEFRTPLTLIIGTLDLLKRKNFSKDEINENYSKIDRYTRILKRLIDDIMDMRKIEKDTLHLKLQKIEVSKFVRQLCDNFASLFVQKNIQFEFKTHIIGDAFILADELRFESIIYNLLSNAFKFTAENGKVSCTLTIGEKAEHGKTIFSKKIQKKYVRIAIADNGIGIASDELNQIFNQFYTANNDQNVNKLTGTGIGLPFARKLVQLHKGYIEVKSAPGKGSEFSVDLPLDGSIGFDQIDVAPTTEMIQIPTNQLETAENHENEKSAKDKELILVVDDNADLRALLRRSLPSKYHIIEACDGEEAWNITSEQLPDLIITDILMPKLSGIELCERIKTTDITNHIPVIMLTALPSVEDRILGLKKGADSYIPKPFETEHLLIRVEKLIEIRKRLKNKLLRNYWATPTMNKEEEKADPNLEFINKVRSCVEKNIANPDYSVVELCKELTMSNMQLFRKFKSTMDISANKFIRLMRLQKSKALFEKGGLNVAEVTYSVGFNDLRYFRTCFREEFGMTPSEYIKQFNNNAEDIDDDVD